MPVDFAQARFRRVDDFGKGAEFLQQRLCQRFGVAAGQRREQRHLQQLIVAQRVRPGAVKPLAQPFAMAVIMRRLGGLVAGVWLVLAGIGVKHAVPASFCNSEVREGGRFRSKKGAARKRRLRLFQISRASGLHGRERIAVAILRQRADIREAEMIAGDHALFGDDAIEEGAAGGFRLRPIGIEDREPAGVSDEQLVDAGDVALDEELLSARGHQERRMSDGMARRGDGA